MKKFITKKTKVFNRFLSLVLIVALFVGMIPESVYAGNQKTSKISKEYTQGDFVYTYTVESSWGNSVSATIDVKNQGDKSINNWQLVLYYNGIIDNIWNADITSNENGRIVISAKDYNKTIKSGKSVSFGLIAHGENRQPEMPEKIVSYEADCNQGGSLDVENPDEKNPGEGMNADGSQTNDTGNENTGDGTTDNTNITHIFPEEQKGLNYALLTTGESNLNIYSSQLQVNGDVHTNKTFHYSGTSIKVDGTLEASERVVLYTSSSADAKKIGKKVESATTISMPDITEKIYTYAKTNGTYSKDSISYNTIKLL